MFINISTENIILYDTDNSYLIPFRDVEQELTKICINSYKKYLPDTIYVLNGPWSFTNLRVWSLVVNILLLLNNTCKIYTIDKLSLYRSVVNRWFLPDCGYIFMWQRKNVRYYDFKQDTYTTYSKWELQTNMLHNTDSGQNSNFFVDLFVWEDFAEYFQWSPNMINVIYKEDLIVIVFLDEEYNVTDLFSPTQKMEPYYAMEPNIW